jgi:5-methylthioadenosine/S-adenosylhomocysteine deaminase
MFDEMRLAATLQAVRHEPGALTAKDALWMATREGARTVGLENEIGSIETGKRADLILVERDRAHLAPDADPWSSLAYAARGTDVRMTMVDGEILVDGFALSRLDGAAVIAEGKQAARDVAQRAGITLGDTQG